MILFIVFSIYFDICLVGWWVGILRIKVSNGINGIICRPCRLGICIFVCWWGLVFDGISYPCGLMITRYIGLLGLVVGFSFFNLFWVRRCLLKVAPESV